MEQFTLTQADIDRLAAANISSSFDANVGDPATESEIEFLNGPQTAPVSAAVQPKAVETFAPPEADVGPDVPNVVPAAPAAVAPAPTQNNMALIQQMLAAQAPPVPADPYENMSKTQRRMLAFAGLSDAGAALQGLQGTSVNNMMARFNEQADMTRKATAAQAQQQLYQGLLQGPGGMGAMPPNATAQEIDGRIAQLTSMLASPAGASLAPFVTAEVARLNSMKEQAGQSEKSAVSGSMGINAVDALLSSDQLNEITGKTGVWNSIKNQFGNAPEYAQLISYVEQIRGLNFLEAFQQLKGSGPTSDTEGEKATAARSRIDAALKGRPDDLRGALMEVRDLFQDAVRKNPYYTGTTSAAPTPTSISPEAQAIIDELNGG